MCKTRYRIASDDGKGLTLLRKVSFKYLTWILLLTCFGLGHLQASETKETSSFQINKAMTETKKIISVLSRKNITSKSLSEGINQLESLLQDAKDCVSVSTKKIDEIDSKIKRYFGKTEDQIKTVDMKYLEENKKVLVSQAATCRLFAIKTKENIEKFRAHQLDMKKKVTFTRGENLFTRIITLNEDWQKLSLPVLSKQSFAAFFQIRILLFVLTFLFIANVLTYLSRRLMRKKWRRQKMLFIMNVGLIFFSMAFMFLYQVSPPYFKVDIYNKLIKEFYLLCSIGAFSFFSIQLIFGFRRFPDIDKLLHFKNGTVYVFTMIFVGTYFLQKIGLTLLNLWQSPSDIIYTFQDLILFISLVVLLSLIEYFIKCNQNIVERYIKRSVLNQVIISFAVLLIAFDFLGFNVLAINIAYIVYSLMFIGILGYVLYRLIDKVYEMLSFEEHYQAVLQHHFGFSQTPPYLEFSLLNLIAKITLFIGISHLFAYLIGEASYFIDKILIYFFEGFHIAGLIILPYQLLIAITAFCFFSLLARKISTHIKQNQFQESDEDEKQVAFASITLYIGISLSLVISLLIAGFNFTSLTIIAGALSVGIGLGLQPIVNNFVSGIILLIEKPIKPGDRIQIDNIEGFVKKIRVRSTQIMTPAKEDIIVPNSDFITHQVKNYMFQDKVWRIKASVGVAYGSDVELVSQLLKQVALEHPSVLKRAPNEPSVFFREFGSSALLFELWCLIKDVNTKYRVGSEINFAINKVFKENNICIAFPQQDVHIKLDKDSPSFLKKLDTKKD